MDGFGTAKNFIINPTTLPMRNGKRPITIRGPLHVQCNDYGDYRAMHYLVEQVLAWPDIEATPLPIASANLVSLRVAAEAATDEPHVFIAGREFGRILFGAPTIYLSLPLGCAHWAIVRGWAEPHFSTNYGLLPPGVMVVYTPRNEQELSVCRSLFWISYNFSLSERRRDCEEWNTHLVDPMQRTFAEGVSSLEDRLGTLSSSSRERREAI